MLPFGCLCELCVYVVSCNHPPTITGSLIKVLAHNLIQFYWACMKDIIETGNNSKMGRAEEECAWVRRPLWCLCARSSEQYVLRQNGRAGGVKLRSLAAVTMSDCVTIKPTFKFPRLEIVKGHFTSLFKL